MNFDYSPEQIALKEQLRRLLADAGGPAAARAVIEGAMPLDRGLWSSLGELGWLAAAIPADFGGQGLDHVTLCGIAEELGRALSPVPVASSIFGAAEAILAAGTSGQKQALLPRLASGESIGTLALWEGPGRLGPQAIGCRVEDGRLTGGKTAVPDGGIADIAVVAAKGADGRIGLYVVDLAADGVTRTPCATIDGSRPYAALSFAQVRAEMLGNGPVGWPTIETLLHRLAVLTAFEQVGGAAKCLELACDYALARQAFGRPIGSYQAVKHRLAEMYIAIELARSNAYFAAWALESDDEKLPLAAATARISAIDAYERAARDLTQTLAGIAATWAHDAHLYYRRSRQLAVALGPAAHWQGIVVDALDRLTAD